MHADHAVAETVDIKTDRRLYMSYSKKFHDLPLRTIQQQHLPNISLPIINKRLKSFEFVSEKPIEKPYLNARHRHLCLQFAKEFLDRPVSFGDQYTSLMSLYSRTLLPKNLKG